MNIDKEHLKLQNTYPTRPGASFVTPQSKKMRAPHRRRKGMVELQAIEAYTYKSIQSVRFPSCVCDLSLNGTLHHTERPLKTKHR